MATRIVLFSDLHSNIHALDAVLKHIRRAAPDAVYCLGDVVSGCAFPNECIDRLRELQIPVVRGNHDEDVAEIFHSGKIGTDSLSLNTRAKHWTASVVGKEQARYLAELPFSLTAEIEDMKFRFVHGSPRKTTEGIYPHTNDNKLRDIARSAKFKVLCCAHTHYPFIAFHKKRWFVNSGTAGRPKMRTPLVNYVVLTVRKGEVEAEFPMVSYELHKAVEGILRSGLPAYFAEIISRGIPVPRN